MKNKKGFRLAIFLCVLISYGFIVKPATILAQDVSTVRISGSDRYSTAVAISQKGWTGASTVIITSGLDFPDALSASALSKSKDAPILLTDSAKLSADTISEVQRLKATQAIIVGGTSVISLNVEKQLTDLGVSITRIGGVNRYDTSKKVAELLNTTSGIIIAAGSDFPDALSIASVAGIKSMPILLSPQASLDSNINEFIAGKNITDSYIVGGVGALSSDIDSALPGSKRISGSDRYGTNLAILNQFAVSLNFDTAYLVSGENFPDALCGAALAAKNNAPVILTSKNSIFEDTISFLKNHQVKHVVILGGTGVISQDVEETLNSKMASDGSTTIEKPVLSLYDSLKATMISNMEKRNTTFTFKWEGKIEECMDTYSKILKDIAFTNPYEYYNMSNINLTGKEASYETTTTTLSFTMTYRTTKAQEDYVTAQVNNLMPNIINTSMTTLNKELAIHDWIVSNVKYDDSLTRYTAYDALSKHSAVCEGYALLAYKMFVKAGIQAYIVSGTANNGKETALHAWNLVNIDGNWYHVDVTWDDPTTSSLKKSYSYYNLTDTQISKDHFWDKTGYPTVSKVLFVK